MGLGIVIRNSTANTVQVARDGAGREMERSAGASCPTSMKFFGLSWDSSEFVQAALLRGVQDLRHRHAAGGGCDLPLPGDAPGRGHPRHHGADLHRGRDLQRAGALRALGEPPHPARPGALHRAGGGRLHRGAREHPAPHRDWASRPLLAAYRGAREVGFAVIATTLVVIAVFVPIAFLDGTHRPPLPRARHHGVGRRGDLELRGPLALGHALLEAAHPREHPVAGLRENVPSSSSMGVLEKHYMRGLARVHAAAAAQRGVRPGGRRRPGRVVLLFAPGPVQELEPARGSRRLHGLHARARGLRASTTPWST